MTSSDKFWLFLLLGLAACVTVTVVGCVAYYRPSPDDSILCMKEGGHWDFHPQRSGNDEGFCNPRGDKK